MSTASDRLRHRLRRIDRKPDDRIPDVAYTDKQEALDVAAQIRGFDKWGEVYSYYIGQTSGTQRSKDAAERNERRESADSLIPSTISLACGAIFFSGWLCLYFFYHVFDRLNRSEVERFQLMTSVKEAELRALKLIARCAVVPRKTWETLAASFEESRRLREHLRSFVGVH